MVFLMIKLFYIDRNHIYFIFFSHSNYKSASGLNRREMYLKENQHIHK